MPEGKNALLAGRSGVPRIGYYLRHKLCSFLKARGGQSVLAGVGMIPRRRGGGKRSKKTGRTAVLRGLIAKQDSIKGVN